MEKSRQEKWKFAVRRFEEMKLKFSAKKGEIVIHINGHNVYYFPTKEWYSSKLFADGRGFENLMNELQRLQGTNINYTKFYEYWCIDKEAYRVTGQVNEPMFRSTNFQEASDFKAKNPQSVIVRTGIGHKGIIFQQITRHEINSRYSKSI